MQCPKGVFYAHLHVCFGSCLQVWFHSQVNIAPVTLRLLTPAIGGHTRTPTAIMATGVDLATRNYSRRCVSGQWLIDLLRKTHDRDPVQRLTQPRYAWNAVDFRGGIWGGSVMSYDGTNAFDFLQPFVRFHNQCTCRPYDHRIYYSQDALLFGIWLAAARQRQVVLRNLPWHLII